MGRTLAVLALMGSVSAPAGAQTVKETRPGQGGSPRETVEWALGGATLTITYGRPYAKGRKIFGGLLPYGQVWRTGADEATTIVTTAPLAFGSVEVPAGTYTLYALPAARRWSLIISKTTGQWGTVYKEEEDLARVEMKTQRLAKLVEQLTISIEKTATGGVLRIDWENTRASVPFVVAP